MYSLVLPRPDGQEREGLLAQIGGSITKGLQLLTTANGGWGSDIPAEEGIQAPLQSPPASDLLPHGEGKAQQFWQLVLKGESVVSWPRRCILWFRSPWGESHGVLFETELTRYLDVIRAPRESSQAFRSWTVHAKESTRPFKWYR